MALCTDFGRNFYLKRFYVELINKAIGALLIVAVDSNDFESLPLRDTWESDCESDRESRSFLSSPAVTKDKSPIVDDMAVWKESEDDGILSSGDWGIVMDNSSEGGVLSIDVDDM